MSVTSRLVYEDKNDSFPVHSALRKAVPFNRITARLSKGATDGPYLGRSNFDDDEVSYTKYTMVN